MLTARSRSNKIFDNRRLFQYVRLRLLRQNGFPHYIIRIGRKRILYCYIRKNACSAFKRLILEQDPKAKATNQAKRPIDILDGAVLARFPDDIRTVDHSIFVYRDPFDRAVSVYLNKFVQQDGAEPILTSYRRVTGSDPLEATFSHFVNRYLQKPFYRLDLHVLPQIAHLLPIIYTDAIPIDRLHERMSGIIEKDLADAYFRRPVNATSSCRRSIDDASNIPAENLRQVYLAGAGLPDTASFLTPAIRERLAHVYLQDFVFGSK